MEQPTSYERRIHLSPGRYTELERELTALRSRNADRILARLLDELTRGSTPQQAMTLLQALTQGGHGAREDEKEAISQVVGWLRARLATGRDLDQIATEVGWLRRLSSYHRRKSEDEGERHRGPKTPGQGGGRPQRPETREPPPPDPAQAQKLTAAAMAGVKGMAAPPVHVARGGKEKVVLTEVTAKRKGKGTTEDGKEVLFAELPAWNTPTVGEVILAVVDRSSTPFKGVFKGR